MANDVYTHQNHNKFAINSSLSVIEYIAVVNNLVGGFFDEDGIEYTPHYGFMNAVQLFYNQCVVESPYHDELPDGIVGLNDIDFIVKDNDFMDEFNRSIKETGIKQMNFARAYSDAISIVESKKSSVDRVLSMLDKKTKNIIDELIRILDSDEMKEIQKVAGNLGQSNVSAQRLAELVAIEYGKQNGFAKNNRKKFGSE